jgi:hypothetical protein
MARQSQGTDGWPTILWIAWRAGDAEHLEPLCRQHREDVFKYYPTSAHGMGRSGDRCSMCVLMPGGTGQLGGRACTTQAGRPTRGYRPRGSR